jgi:hypothetical protein
LDATGVGYTEKEYDYAVESGKPVLGFVHGNSGMIPVQYTDVDPQLREKLAGFRKKVQLKQCKYWLTPGDLGTAVNHQLCSADQNPPR